MGYVIKKVPFLKRSWKLQYYSKSKTSDIPESQYLEIGFSASMTIEDARAHKDHLNSQEHLKRHNERRTAIRSRIKEQNTVNSAFLGPYVPEFESNILFGRAHTKRNKFESHWRAVQLAICELRMEPKDWHKMAHRFYDYFSNKQMSLSYVHKLLSILNKWGDFVTEKTNQRFRPIPSPTGIEKQRIIDAYFNKYEDGKASLPIKPLQLESRYNDLDVKHYNWLYLSIWLGLRPTEVDLLLEHSQKWTWYIKDDVVYIYQSKLRSISRDRRIKPIPLLRAEQLKVKAIIESRNFKRPLCKTIQIHFGPNVTTYAGRKGFCDLMLSFDYKLEDISVWMGHQSIERTWRSYKNKQLFNWSSAKPIVPDNT